MLFYFASGSIGVEASCQWALGPHSPTPKLVNSLEQHQNLPMSWEHVHAYLKNKSASTILKFYLGQVKELEPVVSGMIFSYQGRCRNLA